jgi:hypothetical protein
MQPVLGGSGRGIDRFLLPVFLLTAGLLSGPAGAMNTSGKCVGNLTAPLSPGNSCSANDVTLVLVASGTQTDGCINTSDTVDLYLGAKLENTSGQTRYDIGIFIYNYLGAGDPTPNAFGGQQCAVETLKQPYSTVGTGTCGPLNLSGGSGPFYNADGNGCADIVKGQCNSAPVLMNFATPVTIKCSDNIGAGASTQPDGFADIATCTTWGSSIGQVGPGGVCSSELDVMPGTGPKCQCQVINSETPVPRLANSCTCSPTPVRPGQSTSCTVSYTNTVPNCTAVASSASLLERNQCGTASFVRYKVGYNSTQGQVLSSSPATPAATGGTVTVDTANQQVIWVPQNNTASGTSAGIIGPGGSGSMTYQFYVAPSVPSGTTINQTVTTFWSNAGPSTWANEMGQSQTVNCSFAVSDQATFARISSFTAHEEDGEVALVWETAAEIGTVAFEIERQDPDTGRFVPVTETPVPAVAQLPGGRYRLVDPAAPRGRSLTYRVTEVDQQGAREVFGPFHVEVTEAVERGHRGAFQAQGKKVSPRLVQAALATERSVVAAAGSAGSSSSAVRAKIEVAQAGLQRVRLADVAGSLGLSSAEASAQLRAGRLRLSRGSQEVSWQPAADGDGLVFHGEALHNAFTDVNVYWLEVGRGQAIATVAARPAGGPGSASFLDTLHFNTDVVPAIASPVPVADQWIWKSFYPGYPGFDRGTFPLDVPAPAAGGATLGVRLVGFAATQRAELWLNGHRLNDLEWGTGLATISASVPAGVLLDGANRVEIVALEAERGFWLDAFDLTYPRLYRAQADRLAFRAAAGSAVVLTGFRASDVAVYDVSQPLAPRRLGGLAVQPQADGSWGVGFLAPSAGPFVAATSGALAGTQVRRSAPADLTSRGAEYVVIAPPELRAGAQRLADLRAAQGLTTLVADLGDVVDLFGEGIADPAAVQRFLTHAVKAWPTPPRYVVLAGKGTYDYRNLLGLSSNRVPPLLVATEAGLAPADAAFADPDGRGVPAVAIGRIPALTAAELNAYVDKLAAYESDPGGPWASRALLVADDADLGGDFPAAREALAGVLPGLDLTRIDTDPARMADSRSGLQSALRDGQVLMSYVGHGGLDRLSSEGLLLTSDVAGLGNGPRLPVVAALTCLISQFAYPTVTSLGEELVLRADGGAIAVYGPTWMSHNTPASALGGFLMPELAAPGGGRLGDRLLRGLNAYAAAGGDREMLRLYTLLGDPALKIKR